MSVLRLPPLPSIKDILRIYQLQAMKKLSQNFLLDEQLTNKIIRKAGTITGEHILEVGPGPGALTRSILRKHPKKLIVVEKDERFKPVLDMLAEAFSDVNGEMNIVYDDIRNVKMENLFPESVRNSWEDKSPNIRLIGNLPFNVSTPLIIKWLKLISEKSGAWSFGRTRMLLTFQKEVAERLVAEPYGRQRCRLSVMAQAWTRPICHFIIPGSAFVPKPDVDVGVVSFVPLSVPQTQHKFELFEKVTRHIFSFRQKYSIRGAGTLFPLDCREELSEVMYKLADIDPQKRAMQLTVQEVDKLVSAYKYLVDKHPEIALYEYRASRKLLGSAHTLDVEVENCTEPDMYNCY